MGDGTSKRRFKETPCAPIELPFTSQSMIKVLEYGMDQKNSPYTHQQICHWCQTFRRYAGPVYSKSPLETASRIALELGEEFYVHVFDNYTQEELDKLDCSLVRLPTERFKQFRSWFDMDRPWLKG